MAAHHADDVIRIYQLGIDGRLATFEVEAPTWAEFDASRLPEHRFVALDDDGVVLGWIAVTPVSSRRVYAGVVEHSVYVDPRARGHGVGRVLLDTLIASTEAAGIWTIQSGVFPENTASIRLHERAGFRVIGVRHHVGRMQRLDRLRDVLELDRLMAHVVAQPDVPPRCSQQIGGSSRFVQPTEETDRFGCGFQHAQRLRLDRQTDDAAGVVVQFIQPANQVQ